MRAFLRFALPCLATGLLLTATLAPSARAAWPHDPNFNVPICTAATDQFAPRAISDGAGGAIITWYDYRGLGTDIYAQRVSAAGVPLWTANGVGLCTSMGNQVSPEIISDGAGGAIVVWTDDRNGLLDIYAQRVNAAGVPQWTADGVAVCTAPNSQEYPTLAADGAGGVIIAWEDFRSTTNWDIYAQRLNAAGAPQWAANGAPVCTQVSNQSATETVSDGAGGAIVAWVDYRAGNLDMYAQRLNPAGVGQWAANGNAVTAAAGDQYSSTITSDGLGGAIIAWTDYRSGTADIYAQRMTSTGIQLWNADGNPFCVAAAAQWSPIVVSDGAGGAIIGWTDYRNGAGDIFAQRTNSGGVPQWTSDGVPVCTAANAQYALQLAADGSGGAILTWYDTRPTSSSSDIYAQRVSSAGYVQWLTDGVPVSTAAQAQSAPVIVGDGANGVVIAWYDQRNVADNDIYAQRIERFGKLGNPEPVSAGVKDVPNDQGGKVKVSWFGSYLDSDPNYEISSYSLWRSAPPQVASAAIRAGARLLGADEPLGAAHGPVYSTSIEGAQTIFWELVGSQTADGDAGYSLITTTTSDSVGPGAGNPRTLFRIQARDYNGYAFWNSPPDSGYSVDNLPPAAPAPFSGAYTAGNAALHWGPNHEADLAHYNLYRGPSAGFVPGPGNLVVSQPDTGYTYAPGQPYYYKLSAVDVHGNESPFTLLLPSGTLDAPGAASPVLALAPPRPNPARDGADFRFALARAGAVKLELFDQQGRRVRVLAAGEATAGEHVAHWDERDDEGRIVPSGLYFARFEAGGHVLTERIAAIR